MSFWNSPALKFLVKLTASLLLVLYAFHTIRFNDLIYTVKSFPVTPLIASFFILNATFLLNTRRLFVLTPDSTLKSSIYPYHYLTYYSTLLNYTTPTTIPADLIRLRWLKAQHFSTRTALLVLFFDRLLPFFFSLNLLVLFLPYLLSSHYHLLDILSYPLSLLPSLVIISILISPLSIYSILSSALRHLAKSNHTLPHLSTLAKDYKNRLRWASLLTLISLFLPSLSLFILYSSLSPVTPSLAIFVPLFQVYILSSALPFSIAGLGAREAIFYFLSSPLKLDPTLLISSSLVFFALAFFCASTGSLLCYLYTMSKSHS